MAMKDNFGLVQSQRHSICCTPTHREKPKVAKAMKRIEKKSEIIVTVECYRECLLMMRARYQADESL